ncbi:tRNA wybutosine-synthesizing protein 4-like [Babylonia areolata]|uniref:tRNA wybutosine-synthesizing protein 4-like n=1 Tax=Babylonia areolata TaxID=304850 RepID=UPI003FD2570D
MEQKESTERKPKTSKSRRETAVQGTNDNSIVSKCSMSAAGYFSDDFLRHFVAKTTRRAPLINRGYFLRAVCIDQVLRQFLTKHHGCKKQIVSLGAGFDSAYFRLKAEGLLLDTSFYEIDFPEVTKRKYAIIQSNSTLSGLLNFDGNEKTPVPPIELSTSDYCLLGVDLTQLNTLEAALRLCGADFDSPTLLLSECVMTYMTRRCSSALVKWAGETFQDAFFIMFEQINPDDAFGIFMQNHFHTIGSPLKCITSFPTVESQIKRFLDLGWQKCKCHDLNEIYRHCLSAEERARIETLDPFDEYEEFNLKCAHYFLLVASTSSSIADFIFTQPPTESMSHQPSAVPEMVSQKGLPADRGVVKRFSHSSALVGGRYVLTAGGFGEVDGRHQRVQEVSLTDTTTMETCLIRCRSEDIQYSRMYHSSVVLSDGRVLLLGGRQSPFFLCSQLLLLDLVMSSGTDTQPPASSYSSIPPRLPQETVQDVNTPDVLITNTELSDSNRTAERTCTEHVCVRNGGDSGCAACVKSSVCDTPSLPPPQPCDVSPTRTLGLDADCTRPDVCESGVRSILVTEREERTEFEGGHLLTSILKQSGDIPCARWRHASALVTVEGHDWVFLHGGRTQKAEVLSDTFMLDVYSGVWTKVESTGDHPGSLHSHTMVSWDERGVQQVVVVGGVDGDQNPQDSIYLLNLSSLVWRRLPVSGAFLARYSHSCHVVGDKLVCVGGVNLCRQTPGIGIVNLSTGQAQEFSFPSVTRTQLLMYHRHDSVLLPDGRIVVLGGGGNCFSFGTHLNHTPVVVDIARCLEAVP